MCISPIRIRNPNYHSKGSFTEYKDTSSLYINVPCGVCSECVAVKQMSVVQRVQMESLDNHIFFCTLTYNQESLPFVDCSSGYRLYYADYKDFQKMVKRLRKTNAFGRPFRYYGVSERGSSRGRPHFHVLFFVPKYKGDDFNSILNLEKVIFDAVKFEWRRNYGSNRNPIYKPLFTYVCKLVHGRLRRNFDLHYVNPRSSKDGELDVAFYVSKYLLKGSNKEIRLQQALKLNLPEDEYNSVWKLVRSRSFSSLGFGYNNSDNVRSYIRSCISGSLDNDFPLFFNKSNGMSFPLARYYRTKGDLFSVDDYLHFWNNSHSRDNVVIDDRHISEKKRCVSSYNRMLSQIDEHDYSSDFTNF